MKPKNQKKVVHKHEVSHAEVNDLLNELFCSVEECLFNVKQGISIPNNVRSLRQFVAEWEQLKHISESKADQQILDYGMCLLLKISAVDELYLALHKKQINTKIFKQKVIQVLQSEQHVEVQQSSINQRLPKLISMQSEGNAKQPSLRIKSKLIKFNENEAKQSIGLITQNQYGLQKAQTRKKECLMSAQNTIIKSFKSDLQQKEDADQLSIIHQSKLDHEIFPARNMSRSRESIRSRRSLLKINRPEAQNQMETSNNKITNLTVDVTNMTKNKDLDRTNLNKACEVYQIDATCLNITNRTQKENIVKCLNKPYMHQKFKLEKAIYAKTSKSIEAYKNHVRNSKSKEKSESFSRSKDHSRSLIRRQYQTLRSREKEQKSIDLTSNNSKSGQTSNYAQFFSSVHQQKHMAQNCPTELLVDKSLHYFSDRSSKFKKNCLRNKSLLFDSSDLQIGYVHYRKGRVLDFTLFVTAKVHLQSLEINIQNSQNLQTHAQITKIQHLQTNRQYSLKIQTILKSIPFQIPKIVLTLKHKRSSNKQHINLYLPCSINKYLDYDYKSCQNEINISESHSTSFRTYYFKLIKKLSKTENMSKMLPFFRLISVNNQLDTFRTQCKFETGSYVIDLIQEQKNAWFLLGTSTNGQTNYLQFMLHTFFHFLSE